MNEPESPTPDPASRIAALEAELARVKHERDLYKADIHRRMRQYIDSIPPITLDEAREMMAAPQGESIHAVIAEYESRLYEQ